MKSTPLQQRLGFVARLLICLLLLFWIFRRIDMQDLASVLRQTTSHWPWWIVGLGMTFLGLLAGVVRWKLILDAQGLRLSFLRVFQVFFIGQFFNAFMLGACGGDVARAYYASLDAPGRRAEAASTVFVDRAIGLFAMIVFCCVMIALRIPLFLDHRGTRGPGILMFFFLIGSVVAIFALFRRNLFEHWPFFQRLEQSHRLGALIRRTYDAFYLYRHRHGVLFLSVFFSVLNMSFLTLACYSFGESLDIQASLIDYFTLFPIISVVAAIPVTPGSLGVREGLFATMFGAIDVPAHFAVPLSLMGYIGSVAWSLFGGLMFVGHSAHAGRALREELHAVQQEPAPFESQGPTA